MLDHRPKPAELSRNIFWPAVTLALAPSMITLFGKTLGIAAAPGRPDPPGRQGGGWHGGGQKQGKSWVFFEFCGL